MKIIKEGPKIKGYVFTACCEWCGCQFQTHVGDVSNYKTDTKCAVFKCPNEHCPADVHAPIADGALPWNS